MIDATIKPIGDVRNFKVVHWGILGCVRQWSMERDGESLTQDSLRQYSFRVRRLQMNIHTMVCLNLWRRLRTLRDSCRGQDLIEYALMAGLVATGIVTMSPAVADNFVIVMSKVNSVV